MLTSVDKMLIRFIFAKDMQLHYIWYYKILIKPCSCYSCEHLLLVAWLHFPPEHMDDITMLEADASKMM